MGMENFTEFDPAKHAKGLVLETVRQNGPGSPETSKAVDEWYRVRQEVSTSSIDDILLNIDLSDMYIAVGDLDEAEVCLSQSMHQAEQENNEELYNRAQEKLRALDELRAQ